MARKSITERIASQAEKIARDQARLDLMRGLEKKAAKKRDDRRKILIGAAVIGEIERDPEFKFRVRQMLHNALTRPIDRDVLRDLLPEGSHPPAANSDAPPGNDAKTTLPVAAAEVARPSEAATRIATELNGLIADQATSGTDTRRTAEG